MTNPLLDTSPLPRFGEISPDHVMPAIQKVISEHREQLTSLLQDSTEPSFESLVVPLELMEHELGRVWSPVAHLQSVLGSQDWREAYNEALPLLTEHGTEISQNAELQRAYARVLKSLPADADESLMKAIGPAVAGEIGKILYFVSRALPLLLLFFVPGLNILVSVAWVVFGLWFLAIEYADYPMGNHALKPKAQRQHLRQSRLKSLAFGAGVTVMMLIPVLQLAAMPAAVAGATRLWLDDLKPRST